MYDYKAKVVRVIDGDTLVCDIDLGFSVTSRQHIRVARIDTPEVRGDERTEGVKVKEYVEDLFHGVVAVMLQTKKQKGKFGRYIAEVVFPKDGENKNLSDLLIEKGYAEEFK